MHVDPPLRGGKGCAACNMYGWTEDSRDGVAGYWEGGMNIEHFAVNVSDPVAMADWYVKNLGMVIVRKVDEGPMTRFLGDSSKRVVMEAYKQNAPVPDYASMNPFTFHVAFFADDVAKERERLIAAGAKADGEISTAPNGDTLCFLRDPWGLTIQLAKRGTPLVV